MRPDPWEPIGRSGDGFTVRRVDPTHPANFYWARDAQGRCALVLTVEPGTTVQDRRPKLNGIDVVEAPDHNGKQAFVLVLRKAEDRDLFQRLCDDIVDSCRGLSGDEAFLSATIRRAWKWHSLLRGASLSRLGPEEQQGLIGELLFLEGLAARIGPKAAIDAWRGPLDEPKDFILGAGAVEVKARHVTKEAIKISSEHQLQSQHGQLLHLAIVALTPSVVGAAGAFTLDDLVARIGASLIAHDPSSEEAFESRLIAASYSRDHDYSMDAWQFVSMSAYEVSSDFPRLQASDLSPAVHNVSYWLSLSACEEYRRDLRAIWEEAA